MVDFMEDINKDQNVEEQEFETSILDIDTSDAVEPAAVEEGEYKIRIVGIGKDKDTGKIMRKAAAGDSQFFILSFDIPNEEFSKTFTHIFSVPIKGVTDPKKSNAMKFRLDTFKRAFGLDVIDFNNIVGKEGWALLTVEGTETSQYGIQNRIAKFIAGSLGSGESTPF